MRYLKWALLALGAIVVVSALHYNLPRHDVVRIVGTNIQRIDPGDTGVFGTLNSGADSGSGATFGNVIYAIFPDGKPMVYRNEDTEWGWPPYFKFNSSDIQAKAEDLTSTAGNPTWVVVTRYGWRVQVLSMFPNAVKLREVEGPEVTVIPWFNIFFFIVLAGLAILVRGMWMQFRERTIDPALEDMGDAWDSGTDLARKRANTNIGRFKAWVRSLRS